MAERLHTLIEQGVLDEQTASKAKALLERFPKKYLLDLLSFEFDEQKALEQLEIEGFPISNMGQDEFVSNRELLGMTAHNIASNILRREGSGICYIIPDDEPLIFGGTLE